MSNKYWDNSVKIPDKLLGYKLVPIGKPKCDLTDELCLYPNGYCSQCPIEYEGASYEEALAEKVGVTEKC